MKCKIPLILKCPTLCVSENSAVNLQHGACASILLCSSIATRHALHLVIWDRFVTLTFLSLSLVLLLLHFKIFCCEMIANLRCVSHMLHMPLHNAHIFIIISVYLELCGCWTSLMHCSYMNCYRRILFFLQEDSLINKFGKLSSVVKSKGADWKDKMITYIKNEQPQVEK